jgi:hypothetical protein
MKNNLIYVGLIILCIFFIASCAGNRNSYYYGGTLYPTKQEALFAQQNNLNNLASQVQPLDHPLVDKKLLVSIPTKEQIYSDLVFRMSNRNKTVLSSAESDRLDCSANIIHEANKNMYIVIKKKNIYKTVELVEGSFSSIIQPSLTCDTFCRFSSGEADALWFMLNIKNGKQVFAFDESLPTGPARTESICNAVKAFALQ